MPRPKSPIKARLEQWGLKRMPFPTVPFVDPFNVDPLRNGSVFATELRNQELERLRDEVLLAGFANLVKPWRWVWARKTMGINVGMGKTAFFTYLVTQINKNYGQKFFGFAAHWLAVYAHTQPKTKSVGELLVQTLDGFCGILHGVSAERLLVARLRHRVIALGRYSQGDLKPRPTFEQLRHDTWLTAHDVNLSLLNSAVESYLHEQGVTSQIASSLATCSLEDYLCQLNGGNDLVHPNPALTSKAPSILLNDVAHAVHAAGILKVTFFLDDFYYLVRQTPVAERIRLAADLRTIAVDGAYFAVQQNLFNWVAVMHTQTAPIFNAAWEDRHMGTIAPLDFRAPSSVALNAVPLDQGHLLLAEYLKYQRPNSASSNIYPFNLEGLQAIVRVVREQNKMGHVAETQVEPRNALQAAFDVTTAALFQQNDPAPIGPDYVEHVLLDKPLPEIDDSDDYVPPSEEPALAIVCPCTCHDEEEEAHDVIALFAGGKEQDAPTAIIGYHCATCARDVQVAQ
ncbi:MAG TPA: hypothetical protein VMV29_22135 [Ktedonobacterales bacterium]|nr:hypothetical protein [Ktedonobacterales bacterium]